MYTAVNEIYKQRNNFIIIGVTGRLGSGCSTIADFMTQRKEQLDLIEATLGDTPNDNARKRYLVYNYFKYNWEPFTIISVKDIISLYVLENTFTELNSFLKSEFKSEINVISDYDIMADKAKELVQYLKKHNFDDNDTVISMAEYLKSSLPAFANKFKKTLEEKGYRNYSKIFQTFGDNIRKSGLALNKEYKDGNIYSIAERINAVIKLLRRYNSINLKKDYFVIDAFRNPFEALYFRERYSSFYLFSIKCSEDDRHDRLMKGMNLSYKEIIEHDLKENPKGAPTSSYEIFVSQNIKACIEKSDIHLINKGDYDNAEYGEIKGQIVKYISLIQHPGLITPTQDEKLMQIAYTAKVNSGCISRQVGAVVTNSEGTIVAVGWNDVPSGQTPCLYRTMKNLQSGTDTSSFSEYEKSKDFKKHIAKKLLQYNVSSMSGKNLTYCFKDIQNEIDKKGNQVYTRAIHAEEHSFLQISKYGGQGVIGGTLYSTASPCDLCSKKAYHLGVTRIVYIEPYPGIAEKNILKCGEKQPIVELYSGAIGQAYLQLYEPILSYKDELKAYELDASSSALTLFS